jgi:hypothetical protein
MGDDSLYEKLALLQVNPSDPYVAETVVADGYKLVASIRTLIQQ